MSSDSRRVERHVVRCAGGAELAAWVAGPLDGPPVVLASGGGADHRGWRSVVPELCGSDEERALWAPHGRSLARSCRVAVFDQRGTGESVDVPPAHSARQLGADLVTVCDALLETPCAVMGHSMGGMAALHAVLDSPDSVRALALVATTAGGSGLTLPSDAYLQAAAASYETEGRGDATAEFELATSAQFRTEHAALSAAVADAASAQPRTVGPDELAQVFMNHDVSGRLGEIAVPTVVICGTGDQVHPLANSSFLSEHIRGSRFVPIDGAGHLLNVEEPEVLIDELVRLTGSS